MSSAGYLDSWDKIYSKRRRISLLHGEKMLLQKWCQENNHKLFLFFVVKYFYLTVKKETCGNIGCDLLTFRSDIKERLNTYWLNFLGYMSCLGSLVPNQCPGSVPLINQAGSRVKGWR